MLLLVIGLLGSVDVVVFHERHARLTVRPEGRHEAWIHVARGAVYVLQFLLIPNVRLTGTWALALFLLFAFDAAIAIADIAVEPAARRSQGGLPDGEYRMHIVLSVLVGAMIHAALAEAFSLRLLPTAALFAPQAPLPLRVALAVIALGLVVHTLKDALTLVAGALPPPRPVHVSVRIPTTVRELWRLTQDHDLHPRWDHRFDDIIMLGAPGEPIQTGTRMRYRKSVLGMTISGEGRYKLHRPERQSTFEFSSRDPRSLIARGVGLWLYRRVAEGLVEFSTSYTYEVRWGALGRIVDHVLFRPLFQWETERSFRRLATDFFRMEKPLVLGATGRRRRCFPEAHGERRGALATS